MASVTPTQDSASGAISVTPLDAPLGAVVTGVDLSRPLGADAKAAIHRAWLDHLVLLFPGQTLGGPEQLRFAEAFGPIRQRSRPKNRRPEAAGRDYDSQVMFVSNIVENGQPIGSLPDGEMWFHHDGCYEEKPQRASFLYAIELPSTGGNTRFSNMYTAYDNVPGDLKRLLAGRTALHVYDYEMRDQYDIARGLDGIKHYTHPVFITHPETGRVALYVNRLMTARIDGLPQDESADILQRLFALGEASAVIHEHVWTVDDLVMWDNLCSMHARTEFPDHERRLLRRCVIDGEAIVG